MSSTVDLSKFTVVQLREKLKSRGLATSGGKIDLIERLRVSYAAEEKILSSDLSISKADEAAVLGDTVNEEDLLGPEPSPTKKADDECHSAGQSLTSPASFREEHVEKSDEAVPVDRNEKKEENKKVQQTDTPEEARSKRAERFGLQLSNENLKKKRAERFGLTTVADATSDLEEKKRRRAERFGTATVNSSTDSDASNKAKEILRERAIRFGLPFSEGGIKKTGAIETSVELLEKRKKRFGVSNEEAEILIRKKKRAERFGLVS
ncbi:hypothetical protein AB6A40_005663 [Gnathostoma spinigerum]|uniref:SAP domain-containing protein n=1 Tax=Gnathostoma spinigerum TaxID=75299 RepID=A0ABD6ELC3_9BILA